MKGNISKELRKRSIEENNYAGVFHQQGKVILDSDFNDQVIILNNWQDQLGEDVIGHWIAAVPESEMSNFKITNVEEITKNSLVSEIKLSLTPGRLWVNGRLIYLSAPTTAIKISASPYRNASVSKGPYVIFLKVWRETINAFQKPDNLLEPALGDLDTTERIHNSFSFEFFKLKSTPGCAESHNFLKFKRINYNPGTLTVKLAPDSSLDGVCPQKITGGYAGAEHRYYRIEIAKTNVNDANKMWFKWSRSNGGLVGRGKFVNTNSNQIKIEANLQAIKYSGSEAFYLEIIEFDSEKRYWRPTYGAMVKLTDGHFSITTPYLRDFLDSTEPKSEIFFRLWDGIKRIDTYENLDELEDSIKLQFNIQNRDIFPGDYWNFPVRALIENNQILFQDEIPVGIDYHYVPFAIVDNQKVLADCRVPFTPLTYKKGNLCYVTIGNGGNYPNIETALNILPEKNEEFCLLFLPGDHKVSKEIKKRDNIRRIMGCGRITRLFPTGYPKKPILSPIFHLINQQNLQIHNITLIHPTGNALEISGKSSSNIEIKNSHIIALKNPILITNGKNIDIIDNFISSMPSNQESTSRCICIKANSSRIKQNIIESEGKNNHNGGIQVMGGSCNISITKNQIRGGNGSGIVFGDHISLRILKQSIDRKQLVDSLPGFIYNIKIEENEISNMNGSGISNASLLSSDEISNLTDVDFENIVVQARKIVEGVEAFYQFGTKLINFQITDNYIHNCLKKYENSPRKFLKHYRTNTPPYIVSEFATRGNAGISLLSCKNLIIENNRLEENGVFPVCGIFIKFGEQLDISHNHITSNLASLSENEIKPVIRESDKPNLHTGGIVLKLVVPSPRFGSFTSSIAYETYSGVINDNKVIQGIGRALHVESIGPISIDNNSFSSLSPYLQDMISFISKDSLNFSFTFKAKVKQKIQKELAGTIYVTNFGGYFDIMRSLSNTQLVAAASISPKKASSSTTSPSHPSIPSTEHIYLKQPSVEMMTLSPAIHNLFSNIFERDSSNAPAQIVYPESVYFPNGNIKFNSNQIHQANSEYCQHAQYFLTLDDLEYIGNQSRTRNQEINSINTGVNGFSMRVMENKFREIELKSSRSIYSLVSVPILVNITNFNQGDHCIICFDSSISNPDLSISSENQHLVCNAAIENLTPDYFKSLEIRLFLFRKALLLLQKTYFNQTLLYKFEIKRSKFPEGHCTPESDFPQLKDNLDHYEELIKYLTATTEPIPFTGKIYGKIEDSDKSKAKYVSVENADPKGTQPPHVYVSIHKGRYKIPYKQEYIDKLKKIKIKKIMLVVEGVNHKHLTDIYQIYEFDIDHIKSALKDQRNIRCDIKTKTFSLPTKGGLSLYPPVLLKGNVDFGTAPKTGYISLRDDKLKKIPGYDEGTRIKVRSDGEYEYHLSPEHIKNLLHIDKVHLVVEDENEKIIDSLESIELSVKKLTTSIPKSGEIHNTIRMKGKKSVPKKTNKKKTSPK